MEVGQIQRVRGTLDLLPPQDDALRSLESRFRAYFELYGYQGIDTPILENLDLFLRKSGEEIIGRTYSFVFQNRKLCLRPEFTASVMRAYLNHLADRPLPVRLHYAGPTFRYEKPQKGRYRQFTQVGVECIGAAGPAADAEALQMAFGALREVGLTSCRLVVGHLGAVLQMLRQLGAGEHAQSLVLAHMDSLGRGRVDEEEVVERVLDLLGVGGDGAAHEEASLLPALLAQFGSERAGRIATEIIQHASLSLEGGGRSPEDIVGRLLLKASRPDPTGPVRAAVRFISQLHELAGPPDEALSRLAALLESHSLDPSPLREIEAALDLFAAYGQLPDDLIVDLSLGRGLQYYTGMVFEVYGDVGGSTMQLCGGGRYDDLVRSLGGRENVPAAGFSFGLERVGLALVAAGAAQRPSTEPDVLVVPVEPQDMSAAIRVAQLLRSEGIRVELDIRVRGVRTNLRHADREQIPLVAIIGEKEQASGSVALRRVHAREDSSVPVSQLAAVVKEALENV